MNSPSDVRTRLREERLEAPAAVALADDRGQMRLKGSVSSRRFHISPDTAAVAQHPPHLGQRPIRVEPVERLGARDRVDAGVGKRDRLGRSRERRGAGQRPLELDSHLVVGLDRHDGRAERRELARELAGARPEIEHVAAGGDAEPASEPRHRLRGVIRSRAFVLVGDRAEDRRTKAYVHVAHGESPSSSQT